MTRAISTRGAIVIEALICAGGWVLSAMFVFILGMQMWTRAFAQAETFYLARAQLYANARGCSASPILPQSFVARRPQCKSPATAAESYSLTLFASGAAPIMANLRSR